MAVLVIAAAVVGITNSRYSLATLRRVLDHCLCDNHTPADLHASESLAGTESFEESGAPLLTDI